MVIKTLDLSNPFADYGSIVEGPRFIGRKYAIDAIHTRILGNNYGNLAIMGLPRIGKSSLAWNALMVKKLDLLKRKILIERINIGSIKSAKELYLRFMDKTLPKIRSFNAELYDQLLESRNSYDNHDNTNEIEFFFALLRQFEFRLVFILDEFDNVTNFFKLEDFQLLRELSISPDTKICLVTISRRTIQELEPENGAISNFYGVFSDLRLGVFTENDMDEYWNTVNSFGIEISDQYIKTVEYLVGNHPFLIDLYNYEVFNLFNRNQLISEDALLLKIESNLKLNLYNNFENILNLLKDEGLYSKAIQLVLGPIFDVTTVDEQKLLKYEFIKPVDNETKIQLLKRELGVINSKTNFSYVCFSDYFTELLNLKYSEIDYWPLWNQTEKSVREVIKVYLSEIFGNEWENDYLKKNEKSEGKIRGIRKLEEVRTTTKRKFGDPASSHLIDYTFPRDMYDLFISSDWTWFEKVFGETKSEWGKRFNILAEIRNPIAHNNHEFISADDLKNAKIYCELIINRITQWKENRKGIKI